MKQKKNIPTYGLLLALLLVMASSCNDFLDELPDNRAELDSQEKIIMMLASAYPRSTNVMLYEYRSDNHDSHDWNLNSNNYLSDLWNWVDFPNRSGNDNSFRSWQFCYQSIASCNQILEAIEAKGNPQSLQSAKGEALVARAWNHFELATLFCLPYGATSDSDPGLPYMKKLETTVRPNYSRGTVADFYKNMKDDLEAGLPLIDNNLHIQPKFHFNISAAYAFATKFYMNCGKFEEAIECATKVLGANPKQVLYNWKATKTMGMDSKEQPDAYLSKNNPAALLVSYPVSNWCSIGPNKSSSGNKYSHASLLSRYETLESSGPWGNSSNIYVRTWWNSNANKIFHRKIASYFEYTDPVARIGFEHTGIVHFTTDETLLYRAEAYIHTKQYAKAFEDLDAFITNYTNSSPDYNSIVKFYRDKAYHYPEEVTEMNEDGLKVIVKSPTPKKRLHPPLYTIDYETEQEWLLHYVLHLRRILLLGEGQRWLDIKRYGITVHRRLVDKGNHVVQVTDSMDYADKRRAMQIPMEIINAGCPENPR